jgi:hypothetical protein
VVNSRGAIVIPIHVSLIYPMSELASKVGFTRGLRCVFNDERPKFDDVRVVRK